MGVSKSFGITKSNSNTLLGSKPISNLQETLRKPNRLYNGYYMGSSLFRGFKWDSSLESYPYVAIHTGSCIRAVTISTRGRGIVV